MKYIRYTLVDNKTNKPVSKEPAKNGPKHPSGITPTFDIESSHSSGVPTIYGIAEDTFTPEDWMYEVPETNFFQIMRDEFKTRCTKRRKEVERGGYWVDPQTFVRTDEGSQNRVSQLVTSILADPDTTSFDFEYLPGKWITISSDKGMVIGNSVTKHVQRCYSWCRGAHESLDAATTLEDMLPIVQGIKDFKADDNPPTE